MWLAEFIPQHFEILSLSISFSTLAFSRLNVCEVNEFSISSILVCMCKRGLNQITEGS